MSQNFIKIFQTFCLVCGSSTTLDLIFLLDGSGSVGKSNFQIVKNWVKEVANNFEIASGRNQIGVIKYSTYYENR